jgi:hypothetical protein
MSETEAWSGKARVVRPQEGESVEALCERLCKEKNIEKESYHDSWQESLSEDYLYAVVGGVLYDVSEKEEFDTEYLCHASRIDDETIEFKLVFYNGGTCFAEMLGDAITELDKN